MDDIEHIASTLELRSDEWAAAAAMERKSATGRKARAAFLYFAQEAAECAGIVRDIQTGKD